VSKFAGGHYLLWQFGIDYIYLVKIFFPMFLLYATIRNKW